MIAFATAPRPIRSVLVANRGEIACRVIRTCRRLGLRAVAVYSDADADAPHVREADEARRIGPAPATQSYLDIATILAAARETGADAVHPGYGFLSENADFAAACAEAGLVFVGPPARAVAAMGSKIEAKKIAIAAGVPVVPGYHGADQTPSTLAGQAETIGYPVLIKASAGGGGRGMRRVDAPADFEAALAAARAEALSAFGDESVLLEKLILAPRHLEVQLMSDDHGTLLHLYERDCSVQRNNQKVLEEAPAPDLPEAVRDRLLGAALDLGRAIDYRNAGTVEFIMEAGGDQPYFLEMNTRLQVEHPVTEAVTGLDLVELQLRAAAGLPLGVRQEDVSLRGHAIEARICAERPEAAFQPALGLVEAVAPPPGLRLDIGVAPGSEIGPHYDGMIAKLIAHGPDRAAALRRLDDGLARFGLLGPALNQSFLRACVSAPAFAEGRATTGFLAETFGEGWRPDPAELARLRALAAMVWARQGDDPTDPLRRRAGFRVTGVHRPAQVELALSDDHGDADIRLLRGAGQLVALVDDWEIDLSGVDGGLFQGLPVHGAARGGRIYVAHGGASIAAEIQPAIDIDRRAQLAGGGEGALTAPLPGLITGIAVKPGARVRKGDAVATMEAMKLVHTLAAPIDGSVAAIRCAVGDTVPARAPLIDFTPLSEE